MSFSLTFDKNTKKRNENENTTTKNGVSSKSVSPPLARVSLVPCPRCHGLAFLFCNLSQTQVIGARPGSFTEGTARKHRHEEQHCRCGQAANEMDGSRGATGAVDVGVSHLNMNINVGGHGLGSSTTTTTAVGVQGSSDANTGDSASSSPPVRAPETSLFAALSPLVCFALASCLLSGFSLAWLAAC